MKTCDPGLKIRKPSPGGNPDPGLKTYDPGLKIRKPSPGGNSDPGLKNATQA